MKALFTILISLCIYSISYAQPSGYTYAKTITIPAANVTGNTDLTDFPLLISFTDTDLKTTANGGHVEHASGYDIVFSYDGTTLIPHQLEDYTATTGEILAWVKLPTLKATSDTKVIMYYGNSGVAADPSTTSTWASDYIAVWHMKDDPTGATVDETANSNDGTSNGSMTLVANQVDGKIGKALLLDGTDDYLNCGDIDAIDGTSSLTFSGWVKVNDLGSDLTIVAKDSYLPAASFLVFRDDVGSTAGRTNTLSTIASQADVRIEGTQDILNDNDWHHVAITFEGNTAGGFRFYYDGVEDANSPVTTFGKKTFITANSNPLNIGAASPASSSPVNYFNGTIDEFRFSNAVKSADWIAAEYKNQNNPSSFYSISSEYNANETVVLGQTSSSNYAKRITIQHDKVSGSGSHTDFPVLIDITADELKSTANGGHVESTNGYDIFFTSNDGSALLDFQLEHYNASTGQIIAWVKIPSLSTSENTTITMYYGNTGLTTNESTTTTWASDYIGVWHMKDDPSGATSDDSGNGNDGASNGSMTLIANQVDGKIGKALVLDGTDDYLNCGDINAIDGASTLTFSGWVKINDLDNDLTIVAKDAYGGSADWLIFRDESASGSGRTNTLTALASHADVRIGGASGILGDNDWHYIAVTFEGNNANGLRFYFDGVEDANSPATTVGKISNLDANSNSLNIGTASPVDKFFNGTIDEFRFSSAVKSSDWILTEYNNQNSPTDFYSVTNELSASEATMLGKVNASNYAKRITIQHSKVYGSGSHTDFPVLIDITANELKSTANGGHVGNSNGYDIIFSTSDATAALDFQLEYYNASTGQVVAWVRIPSLSTSEFTTINMHYGNANITTDQSVTSTWAADYFSVWHMSDDPSGAAPQITDETSNNNDGTANGTMLTGDLVTGKIGNGLDLDGTDDYINCGDIDDIDGAATLTFSAWIKCGDLARDLTIVAKDAYADNSSLLIFRDDDGSKHGRDNTLAIVPSHTNARAEGVTDILNNHDWHHVAMTFEGNNATGLKFYFDGEEDVNSPVTTTSISNLLSNSNSLNIGAASPPNNYFDGIIDEFKFSNAVKSAGWIKTEYGNQNDPSSFYRVSDELTNSEIELIATLAGFEYAKELTIDASKVSGSGSHTDFPVLINMTDVNLKSTANGGHIENSNGYDIQFSANDCNTLLDFQLEKYDATTGELIAWVRIPSLSTSTNTVIHLYYGNSSITRNPSSTATWASDYIGAWHMNEDPSGAAPQFSDGIGNLNNGTANGSLSSITDGQIGDGLDFTGGEHIDCGDINAIDGATTLTYSGWVKIRDLNADLTFVAKDVFDESSLFLIFRDENAFNSSRTNTISIIPSSSSIRFEGADGILDDNDWHYVVVTFTANDANGLRMYFDGVEDANSPISTTAITELNSNSTSLTIGAAVASASKRYFDGKMDEVRFSSAVKSSDWIATEYANQNSPSTFFTAGAEVAPKDLCSSIELPVELITFTGHLIDNQKVALLWQTASETNNKGFEIERSLDAKNFEKIGFVQGNGTTQSISNYNFIDENPIEGVNYYRLKQLDEPIGENFEYSNIVAVSTQKSSYEAVKLFPNPVNDQLTIENGQGQIIIYNVVGQVMRQFNIANSTHQVNVNDLPQGQYFITVIRKNGEREVKAFVK